MHACMLIHMSVYLCFHTFVCLPVCLSLLHFCLLLFVCGGSVCLSVCLFVCLSVYVCFSLSVCLSVCLCMFLTVCLSVYICFSLSVCLSVYVCFSLSVCLSVYSSHFLSVCARRQNYLSVSQRDCAVVICTGEAYKAGCYGSARTD